MRSAFGKDAANSQQFRVRRRDAPSMPVAVDLKKDRQWVCRSPCFRRNLCRYLCIIENHGKVGTSPPQIENVIELVWGDTDRVQDVRNPVREQIFRFLERGD